jgi:hypothetical protein
MTRVNHMVQRLALVALVLIAASACTTARAAKPVERPALEVPPPPPRVIAPLPLPDLPPVDFVLEAPTNNMPSSPRSRARAEKPEPPKPEQKPEPPPADPPPAPPQPASPALRIPENADTTQQQNQIKAQIATAKAILDKTDYGPLKPPLKNAYDQAKNFVSEAEAALKSGNLVYAKETAEKAERLAKELQNR